MRSPTNHGPCTVDGCPLESDSLGLCRGHYQRLRRHGAVRASVPLKRKTVRRVVAGKAPCVIEGCSESVHARGWCRRHYARWYATGDPLRGKMWDVGVACRVESCDRLSMALGYCKGHYTRLRRSGDVQPDRPLRKARPLGEPWIDEHGYRRITRAGRPVLEHRVIMEASLGRPLHRDETVHHRNGDRADNRLENLELWMHRHARGQRVADRVADAVEVLQRYAPDLLATPGGSFPDEAGYSAHMNGHGEGLHGT